VLFKCKILKEGGGCEKSLKKNAILSRRFYTVRGGKSLYRCNSKNDYTHIPLFIIGMYGGDVGITHCSVSYINHYTYVSQKHSRLLLLFKEGGVRTEWTYCVERKPKYPWKLFYFLTIYELFRKLWQYGTIIFSSSYPSGVWMSRCGSEYV